MCIYILYFNFKICHTCVRTIPYLKSALSRFECNRSKHMAYRAYILELVIRFVLVLSSCSSFNFRFPESSLAKFSKDFQLTLDLISRKSRKALLKQEKNKIYMRSQLNFKVFYIFARKYAMKNFSVQCPVCPTFSLR